MRTTDFDIANNNEKQQQQKKKNNETKELK